MSALRGKILARIARHGSMSVADYMSLCLSDAEHGYYASREPFGLKGDFVTAPEISQMFGEIVAMWCVYMWQAMGAPAAFALVELGPGRGALMRDVLRASRVRPQFAAAAQIHLVETSPRLRAAQAATLRDVAGIAWHDGVDDLPALPAIIIANEFLDALPIRQFQFTDSGWRERLIDTDAAGGLAWTLAATPPGDVALPPAASANAIAERGAMARDIVARLGAHVARHDGAALIVDYGYLGPAFGDTLQAVSGHTYADPLVAPGEADLTAHVDFSALKAAAEQAGALCTGAMPQGEFLDRLGIGLRADQLKRAARERAGDVDAALERLTSPAQMGTLFKAMAVFSARLDPPPPFSAD